MLLEVHRAKSNTGCGELLLVLVYAYPPSTLLHHWNEDLRRRDRRAAGAAEDGAFLVQAFYERVSGARLHSAYICPGCVLPSQRHLHLLGVRSAFVSDELDTECADTTMLETSDTCTVRGSMVLSAHALRNVPFPLASTKDPKPHARRRGDSALGLRPEALGMRFFGATQFECAAPVVCPSSQRWRSVHTTLRRLLPVFYELLCGGNHRRARPRRRSTTPAPFPTSLVLSFKHTPAVLSLLSAILASTNITSPQTTTLKMRPSPPHPSPPSPRASSASLWTTSRPRLLTAPPAAGGAPGQLLAQLTGTSRPMRRTTLRPSRPALAVQAIFPPARAFGINHHARACARTTCAGADADSLDPALVAPRAFPLSRSSLRAHRSPRWAWGDIGVLGAAVQWDAATGHAYIALSRALQGALGAARTYAAHPPGTGTGHRPLRPSYDSSTPTNSEVLTPFSTGSFNALSAFHPAIYGHHTSSSSSQGTGGLSNALPELVRDSGLEASFEIPDVLVADSSMSPMEI
ncbi:hypothetical protein B0H11DRAFT_2222459 [Mycena galericulata]|nr:hypothetical protein B0H11DRAFT_2222459 [Mycena galericulata]